MNPTSGEQPLRVALFLDAENLHAQATKAGLPFSSKLITSRARAEGNLIYARAYADWSQPWLRNCMNQIQLDGMQLEQLCGSIRGKNSADMQMAMDALEMCLSPAAPDVVVLASGDRDFVPLAHKLRHRSIRLVGLGIEGSGANLCGPFATNM